MEVNYVLMYGTPYLKYKEFETFEDASKFLVNKSIVNYSIFKKIEDYEEVRMIYRDNDIRYLEQENENLKQINEEHRKINGELREEIKHIANCRDKAIEKYTDLQKENEQLRIQLNTYENPDLTIKDLKGNDE